MIKRYLVFRGEWWDGADGWDAFASAFDDLNIAIEFAKGERGDYHHYWAEIVDLTILQAIWKMSAEHNKPEVITDQDNSDHPCHKSQ